MVEFVLKIFRKLPKISPLMTKLLSSAPILLATRSKYVSKDCKKMEKSFANKKFVYIFFHCLKSSETYAKTFFIKIGAKKIC